MKFKKIVNLYFTDCETRLKENTIRTKRVIIDLKIMPYFGKLRMNDITAVNIRSWQNMMLKKGYSQTYLKTINNKLSTIFKHAVQLCGLKYNPCKKEGNIGKSKAEEMLFWTGISLGELLSLTASDIDFDKKMISINQ